MLALECRIWDLECVEDTHMTLPNEVGQGTRDTKETHLARLLQRQRRIQRAVFFELLPGQTSVELDQIQIVRLHPRQIARSRADFLQFSEMSNKRETGWWREL